MRSARWVAAIAFLGSTAGCGGEDVDGIAPGGYAASGGAAAASSTGGMWTASGGALPGSGGSTLGTGGATGGSTTSPATGGTSTGGDATGGTETGESTCVRGVQTGDDCNPTVDTEPCVRSDRECTCDAGTSQWDCEIDEGTGGIGAGGTTGSATGGVENTGGTETGGQENTGGGELPELQKFVGNITTGRSSMDVEGRTYSDYWDQVTPENAGKWGSVQSNAGSSFNWGTLDTIYDYAQNANIIFKQHVFVWGPQQPSGAISEQDVKNWMNAFCERYPNTRIIDVVNEPPPHTEPSYSGSIGGGTNSSWQWIINCFNWARDACPDAILMLNDYNNVEWPDQTQHFIDITKAVQNANAPIDAIGAQAHGLSNSNADQMSRLMTQMHDQTGLPVYVTEYDINLNDDNAQLQRYQEHFEFFLDTDWIPGITVWGWVYGSTWVANSGLIRNGNARPAFTWLMERLGRPAP